jgi:CRISPR-associated protein Cas1
MVYHREKMGAEEQMTRVPLFEIDRVIIVGRAPISVGAIHAILRQKCPITFLTRSGKNLGSVTPPVRGSSLLRVRQLDLARNIEFRQAVSEGIVYAKVSNSRQVLIRLRRNRELSLDHLDRAIDRLQKILQEVGGDNDVDSLRGLEGAAAAAYFSGLEGAFPDWAGFKGRNRRPPRDPVNAVLSFIYSLLSSEIESYIVGAGLDPCIGFLHGLGYGRPSLALDLVEPYRAPVADMLALHLFGHNILKENMFDPMENGGIYLNKEGKKKMFGQYEQRMDKAFRPNRGAVHTTIRKYMRNNVFALIHAMQFKELYIPFMYEG